MTFGIQMIYKHIALQFDIEFYLVLCCKFQRLFIFRSPTETEDETITCSSSSRNGYDFYALRSGSNIRDGYVRICFCIIARSIRNLPISGGEFFKTVRIQ